MAKNRCNYSDDHRYGDTYPDPVDFIEPLPSSDYERAVEAARELVMPIFLFLGSAQNPTSGDMRRWVVLYVLAPHLNGQQSLRSYAVTVGVSHERIKNLVTEFRALVKKSAEASAGKKLPTTTPRKESPTEIQPKRVP